MEKCLAYDKANAYLDLVCNVTSVKEKPWPTYEKGTYTYTRKDGQPIQPEDFEAIQVIDHGQLNRRTISEDGMSMSHYWECCSGD